MNKQRLHLLISGKVQGVGYRVTAYWYAKQLGLCGWVRNLADGRVEITAEGHHQQLTQLIDWANTGPSYAIVNDLEIQYTEATDEWKEFKIR